MNDSNTLKCCLYISLCPNLKPQCAQSISIF
uniref:Uncharacterized protein n=1 Tax=Lepeophtheirus salmonis TaxID=72036 RepID=A0A0K2U5B7_LEPSM